MSRFSFFVLITSTFLFPTDAAGQATVVNAARSQLSMEVNAGEAPNVGDEFMVFADIPGLGEAEVATGRVVQVSGNRVRGTIEESTGTISAGYRVTFGTPHSTRSPATQSPETSVPDLLGQSGVEAKKKIKEAGYRIQFLIGVTVPPGKQAFSVYEQSPAAGSKLAHRETVTVTLYGAGDSAESGKDISVSLPSVRRKNPSSIAGRWVCTGSVIDGDVVGTGILTELLIRDDELYWIGSDLDPISYTKNTSVVPSQLSYQLPDVDLLAERSPQTWFGPARSDGSFVNWIYNLDGDQLTLASNHDCSQQPQSIDEAERRFRFRRMAERPGWDEPRYFSREQIASLGLLVSARRSDDAGAIPLSDAPVAVGCVLPDTAGAKAGFRINDEVMTIDGVPITNFWHFMALIRAFRVGDQISCEVRRGAETVFLTPTFLPAMNPEAQIQQVRIQAGLGNSEAQFQIGRYSEYGIGVTRNLKSAADWYRQASEHDHPNALASLGRLYQNGEGVDQNAERAAELYRRAAEYGHADAQAMLGNLYAQGVGLAQDDGLAIRMYTQADALGSSRASHNLGVFYERGRFVEQDAEIARSFCFRAAARGQLESYIALGQLYARGNNVDQDTKESFAWYRRGLIAGSPEARTHVGLGYLYGRGTARDARLAHQHLSVAAEDGNAGAQIALGIMYEKGQAVEQDYRQAMAWYRKAADQGNANAYVRVGFLIYNGYGVKQDYAKALGWFRAGQKKTMGDAEAAIGIMYDEGRGVAQNVNEAIKYYNLGRGLGSGLASYRLALMQRDGRGMEKAIPTDLLKEAVTRGHDASRILYARAIEEEGRRGVSPYAEQTRQEIVKETLRIAYQRGVEGTKEELRKRGISP